MNHSDGKTNSATETAVAPAQREHPTMQCLVCGEEFSYDELGHFGTEHPDRVVMVAAWDPIAQTWVEVASL